MRRGSCDRGGPRAGACNSVARALEKGREADGARVRDDAVEHRFKAAPRKPQQPVVGVRHRLGSARCAAGEEDRCTAMRVEPRDALAELLEAPECAVRTLGMSKADVDDGECGALMEKLASNAAGGACPCWRARRSTAASRAPDR